MLRKTLPLVLIAALPAAAQVLPPPENVVNLSASATIEVPRDWMTVVFSTTREGPDAGAVQTQLKQALDAALAEARKAARPGEVEVRGGNFSLHPRYTPQGGRSGWTGSTEMVVEGRDMAAIAQLSGRIQGLTIARLSYGLSRAAVEKVEAEATREAVQRFRAKADQAAKLFGFSGYLLREVNLGDGGGMPPVPVMAMKAARGAMAEDAALPVEAGKAGVTVNVSGSVQLTK